MNWEREINRANRHLPDEFVFQDILTGVPIVAEKYDGVPLPWPSEEEVYATRIDGVWNGITFVEGPEDEPDTTVNGDIDSVTGEESEDGFDDMPQTCGWEDESDDEGEESEDEEADC